jgi:Sin3 associated polypeptide p18 (SAP18)
MERSRCTPFYLPIALCSTGQKSDAENFSAYVWSDTTLRELTDILKETLTAEQRAQYKLRFMLQYLNSLNEYSFVDLGIVSNTTRGYVDTRSLSQLKVQPGDSLKVEVYV